MERMSLKAVLRQETGKSVCRHIRKEGNIPGVVYKDGERGMGVKVDKKELWRILHTEAGSNVIIDMRIEGEGAEETKTVIVKETQVDPINDSFVHVDFHEISLAEKLTVKVPVELKGEAAGVTEEEGVLSHILWEAEVECLPTDIPEHINVHVDELRIGDSITVKELVLPEGVEILDDPEQVVVSVHAPQSEEEPAEEEGEGAEEPEVIKKGKAEEEDEGSGEKETETQ